MDEEFNVKLAGWAGRRRRENGENNIRHTKTKVMGSKNYNASPNTPTPDD